MLFSHAIFVPTTTAPTIISNSIVGGETQGPHWTVTTVRVTLSECVRIKQPKRRRWHLRSGVLVVSEAAEGRLGKFGKRKAMRNSETLRISSLLLLLLHLVSGSSVFCYAHTKTALSQPKSFAVSVRALGFREMSYESATSSSSLFALSNSNSPPRSSPTMHWYSSSSSPLRVISSLSLSLG